MSEIVAFLNLLSVPAQVVALLVGVYFLWQICTHTKSQAIHQEYTNKKLDEHSKEFKKHSEILTTHSEKLGYHGALLEQYRGILLKNNGEINLKDKV